MNPLKVTVAVEAALGAGLENATAVFHRFIQRNLIEGFLLDVADYRHVPDGPGVLLVGQDVDYNLTENSFSVTLKRAGLPVAEQFKLGARYLLGASEQLQEDGGLPITLNLESLRVTIADRSLGTPSEILESVTALLTPVAQELFGAGSAVTPAPVKDTRMLPSVTVAAESIEGALDTLGGNQATLQSEWDITARDLKQLRDSGAAFTLVDVREPSEFETVNIDGTLIPLGELDERIGELDPAAHIVVHCRAGLRGAEAVAKLRAAGFDNAWNVNGGIMAWVDHIDSTLPRY